MHQILESNQPKVLFYDVNDIPDDFWPVKLSKIPRDKANIFPLGISQSQFSYVADVQLPSSSFCVLTSQYESVSIRWMDGWLANPKIPLNRKIELAAKSDTGGG